MAFHSESRNIVQVQTTTYTGFAAYSMSGNSEAHISNLNTEITPKFSDSKVLILATITYDWTRNNSGGGFRIFRNDLSNNSNDETIGLGDSFSNNYRVYTDFGANSNFDQSCMQRTLNLLDAPATTNTLRYQFYGYNVSSTRKLVINAAQYNDGSASGQDDDPKCVSQVVLMEVAQ
tara:strand:- start:240 stop:767 length:528 start_codon:yes stop_codon:yes gene_type:complete